MPSLHVKVLSEYEKILTAHGIVLKKKEVEKVG
jgi:hypothetical protein